MYTLSTGEHNATGEQGIPVGLLLYRVRVHDLLYTCAYNHKHYHERLISDLLSEICRDPRAEPGSPLCQRARPRDFEIPPRNGRPSTTGVILCGHSCFSGYTQIFFISYIHFKQRYEEV